MSFTVPPLPTETLIEIFLIFSTIDDTAPGKLAPVCSRWHSIVYDLPQMWTRLCFNPPFSYERWSQQVSMYLKRSNPLQIDVDLCIGQDQREHSLSIIAPLLPHYKRWKRLVVGGEVVYLEASMGHSHRSKEPASLLLGRLTDASKTAILSTHLPTPDTTPSLEVYGEQFPLCETDLPFGYIRLQDNNPADPTDTMTRILSLLSHCPQMSVLSYGGASPNIGTITYTLVYPPLVLPNLTSLTIEETHLAYPILSSLSLPALTDLALYSLSTQDNVQAVALDQSEEDEEEKDFSYSPVSDRVIGHGVRRLLRNSPGMRLHKLTFEYSDVRGQDFDLLFTSDFTRDLEELRFTGSDVSDRVIQRIASAEQLPKLHTLTLATCPQLSGDVIASFVGREKTLRSITILDCDKFTAQHEQQMRDIFANRFHR